MKASKTLWLKRIVLGATVAALPQVLLARGPDAALPPPPARPDFVEPGTAPLPPPEMGHPGMMHGLPILHGVDLSEAQQDAAFELVHAQIPAQRTLEKKAAKALDELQRLSISEQFNAKQARTLADAYAQAQAQLVFNRAELEAKLRALLTAEQRQQIGAPAGPRPARP
jgi:periplasmic protein CpxP/Spy